MARNYLIHSAKGSDSPEPALKVLAEKISVSAPTRLARIKVEVYRSRSFRTLSSPSVPRDLLTGTIFGSVAIQISQLENFRLQRGPQAHLPDPVKEVGNYTAIIKAPPRCYIVTCPSKLFPE